MNIFFKVLLVPVFVIVMGCQSRCLFSIIGYASENGYKTLTYAYCVRTPFLGIL